MRAIAAPNYNIQDVYLTCITSIADESVRNRLDLAKNEIVAAGLDYKTRAENKQLYTIPPNNCGNDETALCSVTKNELKGIYSSHMVGKTKPARIIYDSLLSQAPLGRCPLCGFGHASTLDHYLPKSKFPQFSILPLNLIPSCKDCNTGKGTITAILAEEQSLHPYFDQDEFINTQWLYAEVIHTTPATVRFFASPPESWDHISKARAHSHFNDFKLASRYSIEASNNLACLRESLLCYRELLGADGIKSHLTIEAQSHASQHRNSWQTAMFQALSASDWYCAGGFM